MARPKKTTTQKSSQDYFEKLESDLKSNQSTLSLVLGALIVLIAGVLIFNFFNKSKTEITPNAEQTQEESDVSPDKLPGKYTVKENDTLFTIAEKYYQDGYKYTEIEKKNNLTDANSIAVGQVLEIPKLEGLVAEVTPSPTGETVSPTPAPATGGAENATVWGDKITGETYTVTEGDWLSKIAGRAYGDIMMYQKIAAANNISNPDLIEPGMVLKIPR